LEDSGTIRRSGIRIKSFVLSGLNKHNEVSPVRLLSALWQHDCEHMNVRWILLGYKNARFIGGEKFIGFEPFFH
jgi:hypothetical protein